MGYRLSVKGIITANEGVLTKVCGVLENRKIEFKSTEQSVTIDHFDRNMNPGDHRVEKAFRELAGLLETPHAIKVWDEFCGEHEVVVGLGRVKEERTENVWSQHESVPTPEQILTGIRARGLAVRLTKIKGRRGGARQFEFQPSSGGPSCPVTIKRRFWDSFDLLAVPEVSRALCRRYCVSAEQLRDKLYSSTFGMEVRNPAFGSDKTDLLFETLLDVIEEVTGGIRTTVG